MVYFVNIIFRLQFSSKANKILMTMTYGVWFWAEKNNLIFGFLFLYYLIPKTGWSNRMTYCKM